MRWLKTFWGRSLVVFEDNGLKIIAGKVTTLSSSPGRRVFMRFIKKRPFYKDLVSYMSSGPVFVSVLEGDNGSG